MDKFDQIIVHGYSFEDGDEELATDPGHYRPSSNRPRPRFHSLPSAGASTPNLDWGVPPGPYHDTPDPTAFLADAFGRWVGVAERQATPDVGNPADCLAEGTRLMYESYIQLTYGALQIAADLAYMRTACASGGEVGQLKQELTRANEAQQVAEEALGACKASLETTHAMILSVQQRLNEELANVSHLQQELEEAQRRLGDTAFLVDAVRGSSAFIALEHKAMRRGVLWTIKKFRAKYPTLPDDNFLPLFDALCAKMRSASQGVSDGGHPPAESVSSGTGAYSTRAGPSQPGAGSSLLSSRKRGPQDS